MDCTRLIESRTPSERVDALCEFIEFWLGGRQLEFGEPEESLSKHSLPMPLRRLYSLAGRWPGFRELESSEYVVNAFSHQDSLFTLSHLQSTTDGKVIFISENQGVWECRTLPDGEDPPVWCNGDLLNDDGSWFTGEKLVCDSLSRFLATFILQEMTIGARLSLADETLSAQFEAQRAVAVPIWLNGPYVHGTDSSFYLWHGALVANLWGGFHFGANRDDAVAFLHDCQGPICKIGVMIENWTLEVRDDGTATVERYGEKEKVAVKPGVFNFEQLRDELQAAIASERLPHRFPLVFFYRVGQSGATGQQLSNRKTTIDLFRCAFGQATPPQGQLEMRFAAEWPQ